MMLKGERGCKEGGGRVHAREEYVRIEADQGVRSAQERKKEFEKREVEKRRKKDEKREEKKRRREEKEEDQEEEVQGRISRGGCLRVEGLRGGRRLVM